MIVSVSRRTDIPAFYADWFMHRVRAGTAVYPNPVSGAPCRVSLRPEDVHAIVFWTKNFSPMMERLPELARRGFGWTALYTITGAPDWLEPCVPPWTESVETFARMVDASSPLHAAWRFDPITLTDRTPPEFWCERFAEIGERLRGRTDRCIVSFTHPYARVLKRFVQLKSEEAVSFEWPSFEEKRAMLQELLSQASSLGMALQVCCDDDLVREGIEKAHCIDGERLAQLFPDKKPITRKNPTRPACGCADSRDIGVYGTCPHGCLYCYANHAPAQIQRNITLHDPHAESLLPVQNTPERNS